MAERQKPGFVVPLGFYDGPEVKSIPRRIRAAAIGVWTLCGNYSATKLLDGFVDAETLKQFGCTPAIRAALAATMNVEGELSPLWIDARDGGVQFTNWAKWQRTNAEVNAYRVSEAQRKKDERSGKRGRPTSGDGQMSGRTTNGQAKDVRSDERDPETKTETKSDSESVPVVANDVCDQTVGAQPASTHTGRPSEFCKRHPNGTTERCGDCANARRAAKHWDDTIGVQATASRTAEATIRRNAIARCTDCDEDGWAKGIDGTVTPDSPRCTHPALEPANA